MKSVSTQRTTAWIGINHQQWPVIQWKNLIQFMDQMVYSVIIISLSFLTIAAASPVVSTYPQTATLIPWEDQIHMQTYLDADAALAMPLGCRLEPGRDYVPVNHASISPASGWARPITLRSGMRLYGLNSRMVDMTLVAGSDDIYLSGLASAAVTFTAGAEIRNITLNRCQYMAVRGTGCRIDGLSWHDAYNSSSRFDCSAAGYVRNYRLIRSSDQSNSQPYSVLGNLTEISYGNIIINGIYLNGISPQGPRIEMRNVREWQTIMLDAENYAGASNPWFGPKDVASVRALGTNGLANNDPIWETNSPSILFVSDRLGTYNGVFGKSTAPGHRYLPGVRSIVSIDMPPEILPWSAAKTYRYLENTVSQGIKYHSLTAGNLNHTPATSPSHWEMIEWFGFDHFFEPAATPELTAYLFNNSGQDDQPHRVNNDNSLAHLPASSSALLRATVAAPVTGMQPWRPPSYETPPSDFSALPELSRSRASIQAELDNPSGSACVLLTAGIYTLDGPLKLGTRLDGKRRILIGAGKAKTVLRASSVTNDLIQWSSNCATLTGLDLIGLTLQGGNWGIQIFSRQNTDGSWPGWMCVDSLLQDVCIRDMAAGGFYLHHLHGMDNNTFSGMDLVNCPIGWKQTSNDLDSIWTYMDKNMFTQCQWLNCGVALDLISSRPSSHNIFLECRFQHNSTRVMLSNHSLLAWINCDFTDNAGSPMIYDVGENFFISSRFHDSGTAGYTAAAFFDGSNAVMEGCIFTRDLASTTTVLSEANLGYSNGTLIPAGQMQNQLQWGVNNRKLYLLNSRVAMPLGQWNNGMSINSRLESPLDFARAGAIAYADADAPEGTGAPLPDSRRHYQIVDASQMSAATHTSTLLVERPYTAALIPQQTGLPVWTSGASVFKVKNTTVTIPPTVNSSSALYKYTARGLPPGLEISQNTGVISGIPTVSGSWLVPLRVSNSKGSGGAWLTIQITDLPLTSLEIWRQLHFHQISNDGVATNTADPDRDGRSNLIEYALGTLPNISDLGSPTQLTQQTAPARLAFSFQRIADPTLTYTVEATSDLSVSPWPEVIWTGSGGTQSLENVITTIPIGGSAASRRFLRLRVTAAP
jgi:Putative Ig domain